MINPSLGGGGKKTKRKEKAKEKKKKTKKREKRRRGYFALGGYVLCVHAYSHIDGRQGMNPPYITVPVYRAGWSLWVNVWQNINNIS